MNEKACELAILETNLKIDSISLSLYFAIKYIFYFSDIYPGFVEKQPTQSEILTHALERFENKTYTLLFEEIPPSAKYNLHTYKARY
jgi:hypothetical protein